MYSDYDSDDRFSYGSAESINVPPPPPQQPKKAATAASKRRTRRNRASNTPEPTSPPRAQTSSALDPPYEEQRFNLADAYLQEIMDVTKRIDESLYANKSVTNENRRAIAEGARKILLLAVKVKENLITYDHVDVLKQTIQEEVAKLKVAGPIVPNAARSYAAITASNAGLPTPAPSRPAPSTSSPPRTLPSNSSGYAAIISPKEPTDSTTNVSEAFKKSISFRQTRYAPTRTRLINGNKLVVSFESEQQRDETIERLKNSTLITAEKAKQFLPMLILKGINKELKREDLVETIAYQNDIPKTDIRLCFLTKNRNDALYNAVFEAQPQVWRRLIEQGRVNADYQRIHAENFSRNTQCYKCLQFGHTKAKCTAEVTPCSHCAAVDHGYDKCPHKKDETKKKCFNCHNFNVKNKANSDTKHSATNPLACPRIALAMLRISQRTNFG